MSFPSISSNTDSTTILVNPHPGLKDLSRFRRDLFKKIESIKVPLNILCMGPTGAGKSTFINTMLTALQGDDKDSLLEPLLSSSNPNGHVTKSIHKIKASDTIKIKFWDTLGWTSRAVTSFGENGENLINLLNGITQKPTETNSQEMPKLEERVHGVMIIMDETSMDDSDTQDLTSMCLKILDKMEYRPIVIMNKIDEIDTKLLHEPHEAYQSEKIQKMIKIFSDSIALQPNQIYPCKSYHNELYRREEVEVIPLLALHKVVEIAARRVADQINENESTKVSEQKEMTR